MPYAVNIAARAERDLAILYEQINAQNSHAALKWYRRLKRSILSLESQPNRCPVTCHRSNLRHLLYGRRPHVYRVIYRVIERKKQVEVLHIRHGARQKLKPSDLT
ncbi:MAG: type II toxin-antitoxin system RelE/ParE family toxin [Candidatus Acidiferrales bacterium]